MTIASLAEFLRPFNDFTVAELTQLLQRAAALTKSEVLPRHVPPGFDAVQKSGVSLETALRAMNEGHGPSNADILNTRAALQSGFEQMGSRFGFTVKFTDGEVWLSNARAASAIRTVADKITSQEAYADESVQRDITGLVELGDATLKAQATASGVNVGRKKGRELVIALLSGISKHAEPAAPRVSRAKAKPAVDPAEIELITSELKDLALKAEADPHSVSDADADAILKRLKKHGVDAQKAVAFTLTESKVKNGKDAERLLRDKLVGPRKRLEKLSI